MGVYSSSQFLGAFVGGSLGGILLGMPSIGFGWAVLATLAVLWFLLTLTIKQPHYLSSLVVTLPEAKKVDEWASILLAIRGIEEVVVLPEKQVAYLKLDKQQLDESSRHQLSQLLEQELVF